MNTQTQARSARAATSSRQFMRLLLVMAAIAFLVTEATYQAGGLTGIDQAYSDLWHRLSGVRHVPKHTALVVVDEASLSRYPDDPLVFWPPLFARVSGSPVSASFPAVNGPNRTAAGTEGYRTPNAAGLRATTTRSPGARIRAGKVKSIPAEK